MPTQHLHNYLRTHRKRAGFTQRDVAFLIGAKHIGKISRYEKRNQVPHLTTVLAYEVIFQAAPRELFGGLFETIEREIRKRVDELLDVMSKEPASLRTSLRADHLRKLAKAKTDIVP